MNIAFNTIKTVTHRFKILLVIIKSIAYNFVLLMNLRY